MNTLIIKHLYLKTTNDAFSIQFVKDGIKVLPIRNSYVDSIMLTQCRAWNSEWKAVQSYSGLQKKDRKNSLFFISVDEFSKLICCFLFSLIFSTNSTNQRNQRNEFNESTNKIFVDFTKFQRIFNEKFNESTKILKKSSNSLKFC